MKAYARWEKFTDLYMRRAQWGKNLLKSSGKTVDLSDTQSPEQVKPSAKSAPPDVHALSYLSRSLRPRKRKRWLLGWRRRE